MATGLRECAGGADRLVVVDTETTGVYATDRVVEIAIVTMSLDGTVLDVFDTLIQPGRDVSASHIHGITATMVASAPTFSEVAGDVAVRLNGACLVAHNLPFDFRMLAGEFDRIGSQLVMKSGVDTLKATGCRLHEACSTHNVKLEGAHRALADASATAELLLRVVERCVAGSPASAATSLSRTGRILRRTDVTPSRLPDPPLIAYLASRLPHTGVEVGMLSYLELVGRAASDLHIDRDERRQLSELASELGLNEAHLAQAHRRFVNELVDAAIADSEVTDAEYDTLVRIASALDVDQNTVEQRIRPYRPTSSEVTLTPQMTVVFTGDHAYYHRDTLGMLATEIGLSVQTGVSKSTQLVAAADPASSSAKANKARQYGIPVVAVDDLLKAKLGDRLSAHGSGRAGLKVVTCPDCQVTWTIEATTAGARSKRCGECSALVGRPIAKRKARDMWAPPTIEWLTCSDCGSSWHRQAIKGRKPLVCPTCKDAL